MLPRTGEGEAARPGGHRLLGGGRRSNLVQVELLGRPGWWMVGRWPRLYANGEDV